MNNPQRMTTSAAESGAVNGVQRSVMANAIRALSMDAVQQAKSGHPGMPMGMADVATVLFTEALNFDVTDPGWANRDRFVLSAGHGSMLLYSLLYLTGYPEMTVGELRNFRQLGSKTAGHPEFGHAPGIETTTGPLGQGIANAVGKAISERLLAARTDGLIDHHIYALAGDGCLMEGISHEAISMAGHLGLGKLIVLWDDNSISIDGPTDLSVSDNQIERFRASGWNTISVDGHDMDAVSKALAQAKADPSAPWLIACKTIIGYGAPNKQGTASAHGEALGPDEIQATRERLGWTAEPFQIPDDILGAWRQCGMRGQATRQKWQAAFDTAEQSVRDLISGRDLKEAIAVAIADAKQAFIEDGSKRATRVWSKMTLEKLVPVVPELIGGSADLTPSNGTKTGHHVAVTPDDFSGNYIHYGVREHGMAAAMNGIALSGSIVPYGATFLTFTDYCRPSIRLSALMKQRVIYVITHDSIGLGEDGPTHQPVEHLAALRAIPNLLVFRPADGIETAECWELALNSVTRPSVLALSRQGLPNVREADDNNRCAHGGYVLKAADGERQCTLIATGSEISLALEAADLLAADGIKAAIVSMPSFELFGEQNQDYQLGVLGDAPRVGIEAGVAQCWHRWLRKKDRFVGLSDFGASAPAGQLFEHFGLTGAAVADAAREAIAKEHD